jgi:hypothetical protein
MRKFGVSNGQRSARLKELIVWFEGRCSLPEHLEEQVLTVLDRYTPDVP